MTRLYSPIMLAVAAGLVITTLLGSVNIVQWAVAVITLPLAIWLLGGSGAYPVLAWLLGLSWLQIIGNILAADLSGQTLGEGWMGQYRAQAIYFSLCAILAMASGMRCGVGLGRWAFSSRMQASQASSAVDDRRIGLRPAVAGYFVALVIVQAAESIGSALPGLTQYILALGLVKFAFVYLVASTVFAVERGYHWLVLIALLELATGFIGFSAAFKEAFFVILIALAAGRAGMSARKWIFAGLTVVVVVWASLVWTDIKTEYRYKQFQNPLQQRVEWIAQHFLSGSINYGAAAVQLVERIGYTEFYAQLLARIDLRSIPGDLLGRFEYDRLLAQIQETKSIDNVHVRSDVTGLFRQLGS
jgi:hypothetical protein